MLTFHVPGEPSHNGAPQTLAAAFWGLLFFMLLLPVAQVSLDGSTSPRLLLFLIKSGGGFNVFALLLLLAPVVGVAVEMLGARIWRIGGAIVAFVAAVLVPLTLMTADHQLHQEGAGQAIGVTPGIGSYVLLGAYILIAATAGGAAFRHVITYNRTHH